MIDKRQHPTGILNIAGVSLDGRTLTLRKRLTSHPRSSSVRYSSLSLLYISVREPVGRIPRVRSSGERTVSEGRRLKSMICCKAGDEVMLGNCWECQGFLRRKPIYEEPMGGRCLLMGLLWSERRV